MAPTDRSRYCSMQPPTSTLARKRGLRDAGLLWQSWLAGLRVSEACTLRWRDVNLPAGRLTVRQSKTEAGLREVDMLPLLRDELSAHRASVMPDDPELPVFTTSAGRPRDRSNVRPRVMAPAIERADELLAERDLPPLPEGLTAHKLRHTYGSVLAARGEDPAYEIPLRPHGPEVHAPRLHAPDAPTRGRTRPTQGFGCGR
jgi:integrase